PPWPKPHSARSIRRLKRCAMAAMRNLRRFMKSNSPGHATSSRGCESGETHTMKRHLSFVAALGMCLFAPITTADAQQVRADTGSIAIGGSVTGSTVIIGIPQEKVDELVRDAKRPLEELTTQQRENIALLKEKLDLNERQPTQANWPKRMRYSRRWKRSRG